MTTTRTPFYNATTGTDVTISLVPGLPGYEVADVIWSGNQRPHRALVYCGGQHIGTTGGSATTHAARQAGYAIAAAHAKDASNPAMRNAIDLAIACGFEAV